MVFYHGCDGNLGHVTRNIVNNLSFSMYKKSQVIVTGFIVANKNFLFC